MSLVNEFGEYIQSEAHQMSSFTFVDGQTGGDRHVREPGHGQVESMLEHILAEHVQAVHELNVRLDRQSVELLAEVKAALQIRQIE